jgi:hypothetical protein
VEIVNDTPYALHPLEATISPKAPSVTLIVKGTFRLRPDEPAVAVDVADRAPFEGDDIHLDDLGRSLRYATDLAPMKLVGEVLLDATCHSPDGRPHTACDVSFSLGPITKALRVTGDRAWHGAVASNPEPFEAMPIRWERAFGGLAIPENPLGRGAEPEEDDDGRVVHALPNVEYFEARVQAPGDRPRPAGFGPIAPDWQPRRGYQGTRDQRWAMKRAPLPPRDFDPRFHQAAPSDQQLAEGFFRGDEPLEATGLHPRYPVFKSALPGKRLRVFLLVRSLVEAAPAEPAAEGAPPPAPAPRTSFVEIEMPLDTVFVDLEKDQLLCVWRRPVATTSALHPELEAVYVAEEDLASEPKPPSAHFARFRELAPEKPGQDELLRAEVAKQLAEAKSVLQKSGADPALVAALDATDDPVEAFELVMAAARKQIGVIEAMAAALRGG